MSLVSENSNSKFLNQDISKESGRSNGAKGEAKTESSVKAGGNSANELERMLHSSSGKMTLNSTDSNLPAEPKNFDMMKDYLKSSYLMWENVSNICWLDASMSLLIHNRSLRHLIDANTTSLISKIIKMFDKATVLLNDHTNPKDIHLRVIEAKGILKEIQDFALKYLQPLVKFKNGEPDSAFCSLYNLIKENEDVRNLFEVDYALVLDCLKCSYHKASKHKKPTITLANARVFDPLTPLCMCQCPGCKEPDQVLKLSYRSLPQSLIFHFENGAGKGEFACFDFTLCDRSYRLTGVMVLEKGEDPDLNHFVTWIRDPFTDSWLECNDLKDEIKAYTVVPPFIELEDVYIAMYEALDSPGTVLLKPENSQEDFDKVSKGNPDIPLIDLSEDGAKEKSESTDTSKGRGMKMTNCKVQTAEGQSVPNDTGALSREPENQSSDDMKPRETEPTSGNAGISGEVEKGSKEEENKHTLPEQTPNDSELTENNSSDVSDPCLKENIELTCLKLLEKIKKSKYDTTETSTVEKMYKLRSCSKSDLVEKEIGVDKNNFENNDPNVELSIHTQQNGEVNSQNVLKETEVVSKSGPKDVNQSKESVRVLSSTELMKHSEELNNNLTEKSLSSTLVGQADETSKTLVNISDGQPADTLSMPAALDFTQDPNEVFPESLKKSASLSLLRRSSRRRKFTPKVIESLKQSEVITNLLNDSDKNEKMLTRKAKSQSQPLQSIGNQKQSEEKRSLGNSSPMKSKLPAKRTGESPSQQSVENSNGFNCSPTTLHAKRCLKVVCQRIDESFTLTKNCVLGKIIATSTDLSSNTRNYSKLRSSNISVSSSLTARTNAVIPNTLNHSEKEKGSLSVSGPLESVMPPKKDKLELQSSVEKLEISDSQVRTLSKMRKGKPPVRSEKNPGYPTVVNACLESKSFPSPVKEGSVCTKASANKVENIFSTKEWEVRKINPIMPNTFPNEITLFPEIPNLSPVLIGSNKSIGETKSDLDMTLSEFKKKFGTNDITPKGGTSPILYGKHYLTPPKRKLSVKSPVRISNTRNSPEGKSPVLGGDSRALVSSSPTSKNDTSPYKRAPAGRKGNQRGRKPGSKNKFPRQKGAAVRESKTAPVRKCVLSDSQTSKVMTLLNSAGLVRVSDETSTKISLCDKNKATDSVLCVSGTQPECSNTKVRVGSSPPLKRKTESETDSGKIVKRAKFINSEIDSMHNFTCDYFQVRS